MTSAAVVLSGCGVFDGSEIHEAVAVLTHLSRLGVSATCYAPDADFPVIDHAKQAPTGETRNARTESARIARGEVRPLTELKADAHDLLVFPGGFGAAKNLCDFAEKGADCAVRDDVAAAFRAFHADGKVIAMCCIAPVIAAKLLGEGCTITLGQPGGAPDAACAMGATHTEATVSGVVVDEANNLFTTPAYMCDAPIHEVVDGIAAMLDAAVAKARSAAGAPA